MALGGALGQFLQGLSSGTAAAKVSCAATASGAGLDGIAAVRGWPGGWKAAEHWKNIKSAMAKGMIAPWRWCPVQVGPRLVVFTMHDALSIGSSPHCRIPVNASCCQRLCDTLGAQIGRTLLIPTPMICDAVHLAATKSGRAVEKVDIWGQDPPKEPVIQATGRPENKGQDVDQWLRQQERIQKAVAKAGGYPASGILSTVGKDVILSAMVGDHARAGDASGEAKGAKMGIYGWYMKTRPEGGKAPAQMPLELAAAGWLGMQQPESTKHCDMDDAQGVHGGFWDYSSVIRPVLDDCLLDGAPAKLSVIYKSSPELVYAYGIAAKRPILTRYPISPPP